MNESIPVQRQLRRSSIHPQSEAESHYGFVWWKEDARNETLQGAPVHNISVYWNAKHEECGTNTVITSWTPTKWWTTGQKSSSSTRIKGVFIGWARNSVMKVIREYRDSLTLTHLGCYGRIRLICKDCGGKRQKTLQLRVGRLTELTPNASHNRGVTVTSRDCVLSNAHRTSSKSWVGKYSCIVP